MGYVNELLSNKEASNEKMTANKIKKQELAVSSAEQQLEEKKITLEVNLDEAREQFANGQVNFSTVMSRREELDSFEAYEKIARNEMKLATEAKK